MERRTQIASAWRDLLDQLLMLAFACIYLAAFLSGLPAIQRQPYGVAMYVLLLALSMYLVCRGFSAKASASMSDNLLAPERKPLHVLAVIVIPLGISWYHNESFSGAWNPSGYWHEKAEEKYPCGFADELVIRTFEEFRVENNKYRAGLATIYDLQSKADAMKLVQDLSSNCQREYRDRKTRAEWRLKELSS